MQADPKVRLYIGPPEGGPHDRRRAQRPKAQGQPGSLVSPVVRVGRALLRRAAQLVVLTVAAPRLGIEAGGPRVGLYLAVRAELGAAVFDRLLPAARAETRERR